MAAHAGPAGPLSHRTKDAARVDPMKVIAPPTCMIPLTKLGKGKGRSGFVLMTEDGGGDSESMESAGGGSRRV